MKHFRITVKERGNPNLLYPSYMGDVTPEFLIGFFGLDRPDVEWYKIEEMVRCCICGTEVSLNESHDPYPVKEAGRCYFRCNYTVVVPKRLRR